MLKLQLPIKDEVDEVVIFSVGITSVHTLLVFCIYIFAVFLKDKWILFQYLLMVDTWT